MLCPSIYRLIFAVFEGTHFTQVRVRLLCIDASIGFNVFEGVVHEATFASIVAEFGAAIHQVLFRQGNEFSGLPEVLSLQRASGAEGPARAALTLKDAE